MYIYVTIKTLDNYTQISNTFKNIACMYLNKKYLTI